MANTDGLYWADIVLLPFLVYINVPIRGLVIAVVLILHDLPSTAKPPKVSLKKKSLQLDPVGIVLAMAGVVCFLLSIQYEGILIPGIAARSSV